MKLAHKNGLFFEISPRRNPYLFNANRKIPRSGGQKSRQKNGQIGNNSLDNLLYIAHISNPDFSWFDNQSDRKIDGNKEGERSCSVVIRFSYYQKVDINQINHI